MQTRYDVNPSIAVEGLTVGTRQTKPGHLPFLPQITTITLADNSEAGTLRITVVDDKTQQSYPLDVTLSSNNEATALDEMVEGWRGYSKLNDLFSVSENGALLFTATARHANRRYSITTTPPGSMTADVATTQEPGGARLRFARFVARGTGDREIVAVSGSTTLGQLEGMLFRTDVNHFHYQDGDTPNAVDALERGWTHSVLDEGRIWVRPEDAVTPSSAVHMRRSGTGSIGGLRGAADGADTIDISSVASFETSAAAGGLALLRVRMPA